MKDQKGDIHSSRIRKREKRFRGMHPHQETSFIQIIEGVCILISNRLKFVAEIFRVSTCTK